MARLTLTDLINAIDNTLQTNTSGDITAASLNTLLDTLTNNLYLPTDSTVTVNTIDGIKTFTFGGGLEVVIDEENGAVTVNGPAAEPPISYETLGEYTTTTTQNPAGLGHDNRIRINFGAGGTTPGVVTVAADGTSTFIDGGEQLRVALTVRIGRTGGAGASIIMGRAMYAADGIEANAVQLGGTFSTLLDDADTAWREEFVLHLTPAAGAKLWFELARDEAGNNSGGLQVQQPTATLSSNGWGSAASASIEFSALRYE